MIMGGNADFSTEKNGENTLDLSITRGLKRNGLQLNET